MAEIMLNSLSPNAKLLLRYCTPDGATADVLAHQGVQVKGNKIFHELLRAQPCRSKHNIPTPVGGMTNSNRGSLLHSYQSTHSLSESRNFIQEKILANLENKRPTSRSTIAPSQSSARRGSVTARSTISQIDPVPDKVLQAYKLKRAVLTDRRTFDSQKLEEVILSRINAGLHHDMPAPAFKGYPDYYKNYRPRLQLQVTKNLSAENEETGRKLSRQMNHRFFVAGMAPNVRPQKASVQNLKSAVTAELDRAGADISLRVNQMKMMSQGYTLETLERNQQLQRCFIAFGNTDQQPGTITDQVRLLEADKFQRVVNYDQALKVKDAQFDHRLSVDSSVVGFRVGAESQEWVGQGQENE